ncbi:TetR/AcrR family transcriptional regulator [Mycolicibacterium sp. XJ1819]
MTTGAKRSPRSRRSGDEVRARLLSAGREVFAELGYAGATTKEIATRAEVGEVLLFRHFGSKSGLFDEAVLAPFEAFVDEWVTRWAELRSTSKSIDELARDYIELLYGFFADNRELVIALLNAQVHHPGAATRLQTMFERLAQNVREATLEYRVSTLEPDITVKLTFGMVMSAVVHAEFLFPTPGKPSRDDLVDQLTRYMVHGIFDAN